MALKTFIEAIRETMSEEMRREGKIEPTAAPGSGKIPDPRRFAFVRPSVVCTVPI